MIWTIGELRTYTSELIGKVSRLIGEVAAVPSDRWIAYIRRPPPLKVHARLIGKVSMLNVFGELATYTDPRSLGK